MEAAEVPPVGEGTVAEGAVRRNRAASGLRVAACVVLEIAMVAAPWMMGSMQHWAIILLCIALTVMTSCWLVSVWLARRLSLLSGYVVLPVLFLLLSGWLAVLTGPHVEADSFNVKHYADLATRWPGSFMVKTPVETMWLCAGLLGALMLVVDSETGARWRRRFYTTLAVVGASVVLLGIVQVLTHARAILWDATEPFTGRFFATFFEESVGGAFVCMVWPLAAGGLMARLCVPGVMSREQWVRAGGWGAMLVVMLCGQSAQGSLFGFVNAVIVASLFVGWILWRLPLRNLGRFGIRCGWMLAICVIAVAGVGAVSGQWPVVKSHWGELHIFRRAPAPEGAPPQRPFRMRPEGWIDSPDAAELQGSGIFGGQWRKVTMTCLRMIPRAGLLGFGPGTWSETYPRFTDDPWVRTYYLQMQFARQDFLQGLVEWGVLGAAAWAVLIGGAFRGGGYRLRRYRGTAGPIDMEEGMVAGAMGALVGVLLEAVGDFPLQVPSIQLYVVVLLGFLWSAGFRRTPLAVRTAPQDVVSKVGAT